MIYLALGAGLLAFLVWAGRAAAPRRSGLRMVAALAAALVAGAAVVEGLRGGWLVSLGLIALSLWLGQSAWRRPRAPSPSASDMGLDEARSILGVPAGATRAEIETAYRRLILRNHPDKGGTDGLAAKLNAARKRLLK